MIENNGNLAKEYRTVITREEWNFLLYQLIEDTKVQIIRYATEIVQTTSENRKRYVAGLIEQTKDCLYNYKELRKRANIEECAVFYLDQQGNLGYIRTSREMMKEVYKRDKVYIS